MIKFQTKLYQAIQDELSLYNVLPLPNDTTFYDLEFSNILRELSNWPNAIYDYNDKSLKDFSNEEIEYYNNELIDLENYCIKEFTEDKLVVCCGGDWQSPMSVEIGLDDQGELSVVNSYLSQFEESKEAEKLLLQFLKDLNIIS